MTDISGNEPSGIDAWAVKCFAALVLMAKSDGFVGRNSDYCEDAIRTLVDAAPAELGILGTLMAMACMEKPADITDNNL